MSANDAMQNQQSQQPPIAVVALGGNALLKRDEPLTMESQMKNAREAAQAIARLSREEGYSLCVTHGNGPQVGLLAEQDPETGLDVLVSETQGQIGYILESQLTAELPDKDVAALLTRVVVDPNDPAFQDPSKPIGPQYSKDEADK